MPLNDQQLDELLREIEVPSDMKAKLLEIPVESPKSMRAKRRNPVVAILCAVAAIAATVLVIANLPLVPPAIDQHTSTKDAANETEAVGELLAQMKHDLEAMEEICFEQEIDLARSEALRLEPVVDLQESLALAMSVSWQSALDQGATIESVKPDLEYVIASYPNTAGARQAHNMLQTN